jgi:hypothetical protein
MTPKKRVNLSRRRATVTMHRNGLTIEIADVPAVDSGLVASELVQVMRTLAAKYEELIPDAGHVGGGGGIETPDEDGIEEGTDPPLMRTRPRVGF